ncbi:MAG TPA: sigma-70 family RNA polymerase sigma factor [Gemmataceae bacterium]|nr:sigma-70 family RNA polymerase sigma factor [Gemmataceae bacterium]
MAHAQLSLVLRHIRKLAGDGKASDRQLLHQFATRHEEAAFEMLIERHGPAILGVCRRVLRREQDAEDVFQATFLTLARKASSIRKPDSLGCWLYGVASRLAFKVRAAAAKRRMTESIRQPEAPTAGQELCTALDEELARLAWRYQAPIVLCYLEGKSRDEAARQLGWSLGTLKRRLNQGREILRERLTRRGLTLSAVLTAAGISQETVPAALVISTARAAMTFAASSAAGVAAQLAEGLLKGMFLGKLKIGAVLILTTGLVGVGAGLIADRVQPDGPEPASGIAKPETARVLAEAVADPVPMVQGPGPVEVTSDPLPARAVLRLGTERFRHGHSITSLAFADGKRIVATDASATYIWDAATGRQLRRIGGDFETGWRSASLSADGQRLATREYRRNTLHVWNLNSGELIQQFGLDGFALLSPDGNLVASRDKGIIHLRDIGTGKELRSWLADAKGVHQFAFSPSGTVLVTGGQDKVIHVWGVATGKELRILRGHTDEVGNVVFSPDGKILTSVGCTVQESKQSNGITRVWHADNKVHVWDFESGKEIRQLIVPRGDENSKQGEYANGIIGMAFTHDGQTLATVVFPPTDKAFRTWDMTTGKELRGFGPPLSSCWLAFSPDGKILATAGSNSIRLWDPRSGQERELTKGHQGPIRGLAVSPNGRLVASASEDGTVHLWEAVTGKQMRCFTGPGEAYAVTFSPDGRTVASSANDKTVRVWDIATGEVIRQLQGDQDRSSSPLFTPDGKTLACSSSEGVLSLWNIATGERVREWRGVAGRLAFSPDGKMLYSCADKKVRVWDTATGKEIRQFVAGHADRIYPVAFAPNGKWVACWGQEELILVYDLATGEEIQRLEAPGAPSCLAFSPDSRTLACGESSGRSIVLLETASNRTRHRFAGHGGRINALVFWPDGKLLASGSQDTTALVWDLLGIGRLPRQEAHLSADALGACWANLASLDASTAYDAIGKLVSAPRESASFLAQHLSAVPYDPAEDFLRQTLERRPSAEVRHRASGLLAKVEGRNGGSGWLQRLRAIETLEAIATPEAREVLQKFASGAQDARLTQEAKASLERLAKRP